MTIREHLIDLAPRWLKSKVRPVIIEARVADNCRLIRKTARAWATTDTGRDLHLLLAELDGGPPVSPQQMRSILLNPGYFRTEHGDSTGDDIHTLLELIASRKVSDA